MDKAALHSFTCCKSHFISPVPHTGRNKQSFAMIIQSLYDGYNVLCCSPHSCLATSMHFHIDTSFCCEMIPEKSLPATKWL